MRQLFIIIWIAACLPALEAQDGLSGYSFLDLSKNTIQQSGDSSLYAQFLKKYRRLQEGTVRQLTIVHIGGSHVQAGTWTDTLVDSLGIHAGTGVSGRYLFPFQVVKKNGPASFTSSSSASWQLCSSVGLSPCKELGISGMVASTADTSGSLSFVVRPQKFQHHIRSATIFHDKLSPYMLLPAHASPDQISMQYHLAAGCTKFSFPPGCDSLTFRFVRIDTGSYPLVIHGVMADTEESGIRIVQAGVNGASTTSLLECRLIQQQFSEIKPDLVIFSLGVNDVQNVHFSPEAYIARYDSLVSVIRRDFPDCSLLFTTVSDHYRKKKYVNQRSLAANQALHTYTSERGLALWDLFGVMGGLKSIASWQRAGLAGGDKIHLTAKGYKLLASLLFQAMIPQSLRKK